MTSIREKAFRDQGDAYLQDAANTALSSRSRAELAFDAIYMYAMSLLDESSFSADHPHPDVLFGAATVLGIAPESMMPAVRHLHDRRRQLRHQEQLTQLLALAEQLMTLLRARG
jgi:hypothetical protein